MPFEQSYINSTIEVNVSQLANGIYFVKMFNTNGELEQISKISKN